MALEGQPGPDDQILDAGLIKLVLDPYSLDTLDGSVIDFVETASGGGFTLTGPEQGGCGCGGHHHDDGDEGGCGEGCSCSG